MNKIIKDAERIGITKYQIGKELGGHWKNDIYRIGNCTEKSKTRIENAIEKIKKARKLGK